MTQETALVGLVGGLGPAATIHYYKQLIAVCGAQGVKPRLLINHADVGLVLEAAAQGDTDRLVEHLGGRITELRRGGAELIAISAVTPHLCIAELAERTDAPIVDLLAVVASEIARRKLARVAILGTRATMSSRLFGRLDACAVTLSPAQTDRIHDLYTAIALAGAADASVLRELRRFVDTLKTELGVQAVVLAGTDLAVIPPETWDELGVVDCSALHIEAIATAACAGA